MKRHQVELPLGSGIDRGMTVISYGHWGRPVLVFPSEAGRAWDFENNGMVGAVADLVDAGRVKLYCVDSLDAETWSDKWLPIEERALRHEVYTRWLTHHLVPYIHADTAPGAELITVGCSLGAYHAVHFALQRADLAPLAIGLSGNYDVSTWGSWGDRGDATYFANPTDYVPQPARRPPGLAAQPAVGAAGGRPGGLGDPPDRLATLHGQDGRVAAGEADPLRAGPVGLRRQSRLGVVAAAAGPPPAEILLARRTDDGATPDRPAARAPRRTGRRPSRPSRSGWASSATRAPTTSWTPSGPTSRRSTCGTRPGSRW